MDFVPLLPAIVEKMLVTKNIGQNSMNKSVFEGLLVSFIIIKPDRLQSAVVVDAGVPPVSNNGP